MPALCNFIEAAIHFKFDLSSKQISVSTKVQIDESFLKKLQLKCCDIFITPSMLALFEASFYFKMAKLNNDKKEYALVAA